MQTKQFLYFLFNNKYIKFKNWMLWSFYIYGRFEAGRFETGRFETWRFVNFTFCKPDILKPDILKPDVLKPDVLKPVVLWVYRFFDIEGKRTHSIVEKFILKRSEHVYIKKLQKRSEAK